VGPLWRVQVLNVYLDALAQGLTPTSATVEFWVKDRDQLSSLQALLPSSGSLGPLFYAFDLISEAELQAGTGRAERADVDFLQWLRDTVEEAVRTAEQHETLKHRIRALRASTEHKFGLASLQVCLPDSKWLLMPLVKMFVLFSHSQTVDLFHFHQD